VSAPSDNSNKINGKATHITKMTGGSCDIGSKDKPLSPIIAQSMPFRILINAYSIREALRSKEFKESLDCQKYFDSNEDDEKDIPYCYPFTLLSARPLLNKKPLIHELHPKLLYRRASASLLQGDIKDCIVDLEEALALVPKDASILAKLKEAKS
jgi:hypothetical protein